MPTQIGIDFTLSGQGVEPTEISALVGLGASKCWRMGDAIQGTQLRYEHDGWVFWWRPGSCGKEVAHSSGW